MKYKKEAIQKVIEDNPTLNLTELAKLIGINYHYLSKLSKQWDIKPKDGWKNKNKGLVKEYIEDNKYKGFQEIATALEMNRTTVYRIIVRNKWQKIYNTNLVKDTILSSY